MIDLSLNAIQGNFYEDLETQFLASWSGAIGWLNPDLQQEIGTYKWLGAVPGFREWIGDRQARSPRTEAYSIRNKKFEITEEFDADDMRRDQFGQVDLRLGSMATRASEHWEELASTLINANGLCYDGQNFFDTDHVIGDSGAQKNLITAGEYAALNIVDPTAPTVEEAAIIIQLLLGHFISLKDDQGKPINGRARQFQLQVGTVPLWAAFSTAVTAKNLSSGQTNRVSGMLDNGYKIDVVQNPLLTGATQKVRAFRTDAKLKPFIFQDEMGVTLQVLGAGSEHEVKTNKQLFGMKALRNAGYGLWQYAVEAQLS